MPKATRLSSFVVFLLLFCPTTQAQPWFTGPIIAPSGKVIKLGHFNLETYGTYTENIGRFNRHWKFTHTPASYSTQINPLLTYGLSSWADTQLSVPYAMNRSRGQQYHSIGDVSLLIGVQVLEQDQSAWRPDLRLTINETFPTGRYQNLNPMNQGTDATGQGSYLTHIGLNFQHLSLFRDAHFLRQRLSINYVAAQPVEIRGQSSYGGNSLTDGRLKPGNLWSIDLAGEFTITQNWVAVMETYYFSRTADRFRGITGTTQQGLPLMIGSDASAELSLVPAIEYNFSANFGIIAGFWFSVLGKDASNFRSTVIALNYYQ